MDSAAARRQAGLLPADLVGSSSAAAAWQRNDTGRMTRLWTEPNPERVQEPAQKDPVNPRSFRHSSDTPILEIHFCWQNETESHQIILLFLHTRNLEF